MPNTLPTALAQGARLTAPGDNAAIATRRLDAGTPLDVAGISLVLADTILEGHRFAIAPVAKGERILSWGLPFGLALRDIEPGEYLCNLKILTALRERRIELKLPENPNFSDYHLPFRLEEETFHPGTQVRAGDENLFFEGFERSARRGIGTRNHIVIIGTSSRTGPFARSLAERFGDVPAQFACVDGVVPVAHTEGGASHRPNNLDLVLRTLAGFMIHPNVGAVLCVDFGNEPINNLALQRFLAENNYPLQEVPHSFLSIESGYETAFAAGESIIRKWLPEVDSFGRTRQPISQLKVALQCGGSDAFSGVSANPLLGILSREIVARSGAASLAETSELIGAESYVLNSVRDLAAARKFLATTARFQEWAAWHGHSAEGNPSGGNMLRGLYNISIKSIGAARKKDPAVRLDHVIDYAEPMPDPGFYFMDSPGNDLESIAGQVASGCNLILFATGNGSITNFPFVPTIKVMTTTGRFELVRHEMDFNAGRYLDGEPLEGLGREALELLVQIASGRKSRGERAGHSQVQIWREWRQTKPPEAESPRRKKTELIHGRSTPPQLTPNLEEALSAPAPAGHTALVLPTSLCSGQIASIIATKLTHELAKGPGESRLRRAVALPHTEGCGNSAGPGELLFMRTLANYLAHPSVGKALLLEHGCEKTHNDAFRNLLGTLEIPADQLGWASIQLDGGLENVTRKVMDWFHGVSEIQPRPEPLAVGFWSDDCPENVGQSLQSAWETLTRLGGSVILCESRRTPEANLEYGARLQAPGLQVMACPTEDAIEALTGLGAAGATVLVTYSNGILLPPHPLIPVIQVASRGRVSPDWESEKDVLLDDASSLEEIAISVLQRIASVHRGKIHTRSQRLGNAAFQITRGATGISL